MASTARLTEPKDDGGLFILALPIPMRVERSWPHVEHARRLGKSAHGATLWGKYACRSAVATRDFCNSCAFLLEIEIAGHRPIWQRVCHVSLFLGCPKALFHVQIRDIISDGKSPLGWQKAALLRPASSSRLVIRWQRPMKRSRWGCQGIQQNLVDVPSDRRGLNG
jgi:hypothetical protein